MTVLDSRAGVQTVQKFGPLKAAVPVALERGGDDGLRIAMLRKCAGDAGNPDPRHCIVWRDSVYLTID